jgi:hypothetical protein
LTITNPPDKSLYVQGRNSTRGLERTDFLGTSAASGEIQFFFKAPGSLQNGTYEDSFEVRVCTDEACRNEIGGSPKTIAVSYVVNGEGLTTGSLSSTLLEASADQREDSLQSVTTRLTINQLPPSDLVIHTTEPSGAIQWIDSAAVGTVRDFYIGFIPPGQMATGEHHDTVTIQVCYHPSCVRQIGGSPFTVETRYQVTIGTEPGLPSLQTLRQEALGHDVIDAEYSAALDAIITVSADPESALYVYDTATGVQRKQPLVLPPAAVSVSPDGLIAAVGHDAHVSIVDLSTVGNAGEPDPVVLDVAAPVFDLVIDGSGHVFTTPGGDIGGLHSIDIATNADHREFAWVQRMKLPSGATRMYGVANSVPSEVMALDVSAGVATWTYSWPYHSEHDSCINLWFSEAGNTLYTACGQAFALDPDPANDMLYHGTLERTTPSAWGENLIRSLSHHAATHQIALVESHWLDCNPFTSHEPCYTRLAYYGDEFLSLQAVYGIGPIAIDGLRYAQLGRFVFHAADGKKLLIGELENAPSPELRFWVSVVE